MKVGIRKEEGEVGGKALGFVLFGHAVGGAADILGGVAAISSRFFHDIAAAGSRYLSWKDFQAVHPLAVSVVIVISHAKNDVAVAVGHSKGGRGRGARVCTTPKT